jgi:Mg2+ and Co2+ transporter CorA
LKHVVILSQSTEFITALKDIKIKQNEFESDLFEDRERIKRKYESKRKLNGILQALGSDAKTWLSEEVDILIQLM